MRKGAGSTASGDIAKRLAGIDRRSLLKALLLGASPLVAGVARVTPKIAGEADRSSRISPQAGRADLSGEIVEKVARAFFDYEMPQTDLDAIAHRAESTIRTWRSIESHHFTPIDPPFDFDLICTEAERLIKNRG